MARICIRFGGSWHHRGLAAGGLEGDPAVRGRAWWEEIRAPLDVFFGEESLLGVQPEEPVLPLLESWTAGLEEVAAGRRASLLLELQESPHELTLAATPAGWRVQLCRTHAPMKALHVPLPLSWQDAVDLALKPVEEALGPLRESAQRGGSTGLVARFLSLKDRLVALRSETPRPASFEVLTDLPSIDAWSEGHSSMRLATHLRLQDAALATWAGDDPTSVSWLAVPGSVRVTVGAGIGSCTCEGAPLLGWLDAMQALRDLADKAPGEPAAILLAEDAGSSIRLLLDGAGGASLELLEQSVERRVPVDPSDVLALVADHTLLVLQHIENVRPLAMTHLRLVALRELASSIRRAAALAAQRPAAHVPSVVAAPRVASPLSGTATTSAPSRHGSLTHAAAAVRHLWWSWSTSRFVGVCHGHARAHAAGDLLLVSERHRTRAFSGDRLERRWWRRGGVAALASTQGVALLQTTSGCTAVELESGRARWSRKGVFPSGVGHLVSLDATDDAWAMLDGAYGMGVLRLACGTWEPLGASVAVQDRLWSLGGGLAATGADDGRWAVHDLHSRETLWEHGVALPPRHVFRFGSSVVAILNAPWGSRWGVERRDLATGRLEETWLAEGDLLGAQAARGREECLAVVQEGGACVLHSWVGSAHQQELLPRWASMKGEQLAFHELSSGWLLHGSRSTLDIVATPHPGGLSHEVRVAHKVPGAVAVFRDTWVRAGQELALHAAGVDRPLAVLPAVWEELADIALGAGGTAWALEDRGGELHLHRAEVGGFLADLGGGLA